VERLIGGASDPQAPALTQDVTMNIARNSLILILAAVGFGIVTPSLSLSDGLGAQARHSGLVANGFTLNGVKFQGMRMNGVKFQGMRLNGLKFQGMRINGTTFHGTNDQTATGSMRGLVRVRLPGA